jgi:hydroxymethylpyrimidine/phosphomethylpyrimidine kinase
VSYDLNALRVLVDSVLVAHEGRSLDEPEDRDAVTEMLVEVVSEYLRSPRSEGAEQ